MKSFTQSVKGEFAKAGMSSCCAKAELLALLLFGGRLSLKEIRFVTGNETVAGRLRQLFTLVFNLTLHEGNLAISNARAVENILLSLRVITHENKPLIQRHADGFFLKRECCKKAFIRGAFLAGGNISDPEKGYHFEISTHYRGLHRELSALFEGAGFSLKSAVRKSNYILYAKDSELISDILAYMGGMRPQMEFLNVKIEKELRNDLNRSLNCAAANMGKTVSAAGKQIRAIEKLFEAGRAAELSDELCALAELRLSNPDLTITELGQMLSPPLGKSGVNHRMRKLLKIAEEL